MKTRHFAARVSKTAQPGRYVQKQTKQCGHKKVNERMIGTRDDFTNSTKELLAKRVGFRCSNPGCRQSTSGPQTDPSGSVNIGVAAHISAASEGGPRYDPELTPEQRSSTDNGIWLCQTDAKLIDNDPERYTIDILKTWKVQAEATAARELEQRLHRFPDDSVLFGRLERLMPDLLAEMRQDLIAHPLKREFVILKRSSVYWSKGTMLTYYYDDHQNLDDQLRILENEHLIQDITYNNTKRFVLSEKLADYLGAP